MTTTVNPVAKVSRENLKFLENFLTTVLGFPYEQTQIPAPFYKKDDKYLRKTAAELNNIDLRRLIRHDDYYLLYGPEDISILVDFINLFVSLMSCTTTEKINDFNFELDDYLVMLEKSIYLYRSSAFLTKASKSLLIDYYSTHEELHGSRSRPISQEGMALVAGKDALLAIFSLESFGIAFENATKLIGEVEEAKALFESRGH